MSSIIPGMRKAASKPENKEDTGPEHVDVNPFDEHWDARSLFKDIQYRVLFENGNDFHNTYLNDQIAELMEAQLGDDGKEWFTRFLFDETSDYGIELYCQNAGWLVLTKIMSPDHELLPKIRRVERRIR